MPEPVHNLLSLESSGSAAVALPAAVPSTPAVVADFAGRSAIAVRNASLQQPTAADLGLAREQMDALRLWHELQRDGLSQQAAADQIAIAHRSRFPLLATAGKGGTSCIASGDRALANLRNWARRIREVHGEIRFDDPSALVRDYARGRRERKGDPRFWDMLGACYLDREGPGLAEAYRTARRESVRRGITDMPTYRQVAYWYDHCVDPAAVILRREGEEALAARCEYFIRRDWDSVSVNDIWFGDHHDLDAPAQETDPDTGQIRAVRCTLTAWMDAKSLRIVGWQIAPGAGNSDRIQNALGLGIIVAGMQAPRYLYMDNGSDYGARGFNAPIVCGNHEHSVLRQLAIETMTSLPYRAQAKVIERVFGIVCSSFSKHWAGYRGNRPEHRSEKADYFWQHPEHLPTVAELVTEFARWLDQVYHRQTSSGCILQGRCPQEVWEARRDLRAPWTAGDLYAAFLMPVGTRLVGRGPSVKIDSEYYYSEALWPFCGAKGDDGRVLVKVDRNNDQHVFCFHLDGRPICEARTRALISAMAQTPEERARIGEAERLKHAQRQRAYTVLAAETGGTYRLADPRERLRMLEQGLGPDDITRLGERASVKGGSHRFVHYALKDGAVAQGRALPPTATDAPAAIAPAAEADFTGLRPIEFRPARTVREDRDDAALASVHAAIVSAAVPAADDSDQGSVDAISADMFARDDDQ